MKRLKVLRRPEQLVRRGFVCLFVYRSVLSLSVSLSPWSKYNIKRASTLTPPRVSPPSRQISLENSARRPFCFSKVYGQLEKLPITTHSSQRFPRARPHSSTRVCFSRAVSVTVTIIQFKTLWVMGLARVAVSSSDY